MGRWSKNVHFCPRCPFLSSFRVKNVHVEVGRWSKKSSNLDNVVKERPLLPIERLFASMDRVDHQKLLSTPSSTMPYADAAPASKNPIGSRQTCPSAMQIHTYIWTHGKTVQWTSMTVLCDWIWVILRSEKHEVLFLFTFIQIINNVFRITLIRNR